MNKRVINLIIISSAISLAGLIITQTFWVQQALKLAEKQHNHRVDLALENVISELKNFRENNAVTKSFLNPEGIIEAKTIFSVLDTVFLHSLMKKYVDYHNLDNRFYYAIVKTSNDSVIFPSGFEIPENHFPRLHKACLNCLWKEDYFYLAVFFPHLRTVVLTEISLWLSSSVIFLLLMILTFYFTINTIIRQKKISEIRDDLINNITHEFKTPIATISLASEVLMNARPEKAEKRIKKYAGIIFEENRRMRVQVDRILQMAVMNNKEYHLEKKKVNMHEIIELNVENLCLEHCDNKVEINYSFEASIFIIPVDPLHIANVIINLVTNSIKYSLNSPVIDISTRNENNFFVFSVKDKGIGIHKDNLKNVFEKFYRVPTGNVHNVKGFGIGLYYVKTIVEAHKGTVIVKSEQGKGTRFDVYLPVI